MKRLGKQAQFVGGLRVTDKETVDIVQMVLAGKVNKDLVNLLQTKGGHAIGLSGIDLDWCVVRLLRPWASTLAKKGKMPANS